MARESGFNGMSYGQIMMQQAVQSATEPVYCRYCGHDVKLPSKNSPAGSNGRWAESQEWEIRNEAHEKCHQLHRYNNR